MRSLFACFAVLFQLACLSMPVFAKAPAIDRGPMLKRIQLAAKNGSKVSLVHQYRFKGQFFIEKYQLSNGLGVILLEDHSAPVFAYHTWFKVGSRHEIKGKTGIAHLFEHLLFKATRNLKDGEFDKIMERNGASTNASTWVDWTYYRQSLPAGKLDLVTRLEADRMQNMILNQKQLDSERNVVKNERRLRVDNDPDGKLSEILYHKAFKVHKYGWPTIGWMTDISAITLKDCLDFYKTYYAPNNATIVLVGDFKTEQALGLINRRYGHIRSQKIPKEELRVEPPQKKEQRQTVELPIQAPKLVLGYHSPALTDPDHAVLQILDRVLFGGRSSRVYKTLILDKEMASQASGWQSSFRFPGLYEIWIQLKRGKSVAKVEALLDTELSKLGRDGISDNELKKAKNQLEIGFLRKLKTVGGKARELGHFETTVGDFRIFFQAFGRFRTVTKAQVQALAKRLFVKQNRTVLIGVPSSRKAVSSSKKAKLKKVIVKQKSLLQRFLVNGVPVFLIEKKGFDYVTVDLIVKSGGLSDPKGLEGRAFLAAQMLRKGTGKRTQAQIAQEVEALGSKLSIQVDRRWLSIGGDALGRNLPAFLRLFGDVVRNPTFPKEELARLVRLTGARIEARLENDVQLVGDFFRRFLFGAHPLARPLMGSVKSIKKLTPAALRLFHKAHFVAGNMMLGVTGNVSRARLEAMLKPIFAGLPRGSIKRPVWKAPVGPAETTLLFIDKPKRTQTKVLIGHLGTRAADTAFFPLVVAGTHFGGTFTSKLMQEIREKRGWSYGAYCANSAGRRSGVFSMRFAPKNKDTVPAIRLSLKLYRELIRDGLKSKEIDFVKSYLKNSFAFRLATPQKRLMEHLRVLLLGLDEQYIPTYLSKIQAVTALQIRKALRTKLSARRLNIVVVGTWAQLKKAFMKMPELDRILVQPYNKPWAPKEIKLPPKEYSLPSEPTTKPSK